MSNTRPLRVDWQLIKAKIEASGQDPDASCLLCMPVAGVYLLAAIAERLEWQATYRTAGYDFSDWADLQTLAELAIGGLNPMCEDLITSIVNQTTSNLTTIINNQAAQDALCCLISDGNPINEPEPDDTILPPGTPGELDDLCKRAQAAHDGGEQFLSDMFDLGEGLGGLSSAAVAALLIEVTFTMPVLLIAALVGYAVALLLDAYTDDAVVDWAELKHDIVCCFMTGGTVSEIKTCIDEAIDLYASENSLPLPVAGLFKIIYHTGRINGILSGSEVYDTGGYSADYCQDCLNPVVAGYSYIVTEWLGAEATEFHIGGLPSPGAPTGYVNGGEHWDAVGAIPFKIANTAPGVPAPGDADLIYNDANESVVGAPKLSIGIKNHDIGMDTLADATIEQFKLIITYNGGATYLERSFPVSSVHVSDCMVFNLVGESLQITDCTLSGLGSKTITVDFDLS